MKKLIIIAAIFTSGCASMQPDISKGLENTQEIQVNSPEIIQRVTGNQNEY